MKLFFDTSALIRKYINEKGSKRVDELFDDAKKIYVSEITELETVSTFNKLLHEKAVSEADYDILKKEFEVDFVFFEIIEMNREIIEEAKRLMEKYPVKTLGAVQIASVKQIRDEIDYFVVCDKNLISCCEHESIRVMDPLSE